MKNFTYFIAFVILIAVTSSYGQLKKVAFDKIASKLIEWRHHLHQNPELSNREFKTAQ